jgi:hypothetical protein
MTGTASISGRASAKVLLLKTDLFWVVEPGGIGASRCSC